MSVDTTTRKQEFAMDSGATKDFTFTFAALRAVPTDIKCSKINATGTVSTLAYTTDYSVIVNVDGDGGVVTVVDSSGTDTLFVYRDTTDTQESDYEDYNQFPANTVEHDIDRRTLKSQESDDDISRALKFNIYSDISDIDLPTPVNEKGLKWSGTGGTLVNTTFDVDSASSLAASSATVAQAAATAASISETAAASSATVSAAAEVAASSHATVAAKQAGIATTQATIATTQATIATTQATIATTQATLAASSATVALGAETNASSHATTSLEQAAIATTQASIATTQATVATTQATIATTQASIATTQATLAASSATVADSHATVASGEAVLAASSATVSLDAETAASSHATVAANEATDAGSYATTALGAETNAGSHATTALEQAVIATTQATISTTQATIATTQATLAASSATVATEQANVATTQATLAASSATVATGIADGFGATTPGTPGSIGIGIATTGATPTWTTQYDYNNLFGSSGRASGGEVTSASTTSINIAAGTGFIKATDDDTAELLSFDWPANNGVSVNTNSTCYVKVEYNSGSPRAVMTTTEDWDLDTSWPLAKIVQEGGDIHILNTYWWVTDGMTNIIERFQADGDIVRDKNIGGLILSTDASRQVAVTPGTLWSRLNEFAISGQSLGDSFEVYFRTTSTLWVDTDETVLPITQWNNLTTNTLETIGNNRYFNWWIYAEADDDEISAVYPQATYVSSAGAEAEAPPTAIPNHIAEHGILIGRVLCQEGTSAPILTQSVFTEVFTAAQASDHGNLSGLSGDDHPQYVPVNGTRAATISTLLITTSATIANLTASNISIDAGTIAGAVTGVTQAASDNSTKLATTAYADASGGGAVSTFGNLTVTTQATIAALTVSTMNVVSMDAVAASVSSLLVTTSATIANAIITTLTAGTITVDGSLVNPDISKSLCIESVATGDTITMFKLPSAATITAMWAVVTGTSPSATWVIKHGTDRSSGGSSVLTAGTITSDVTTGSTVTVFTDATIALGSWVWANIIAVTGTVDTLNITVNYRMDS